MEIIRRGQFPPKERRKVKTDMEHKFIESSAAQAYRRVIFCEKCGRIAYNFNWSSELNEELQTKIGPCVEVKEDPIGGDNK